MPLSPDERRIAGWLSAAGVARVQPLLATIVLSVFVGLASPLVDRRARLTIALIAIAVTATYLFLPRFM